MAFILCELVFLNERLPAARESTGKWSLAEVLPQVEVQLGPCLIGPRREGFPERTFDVIGKACRSEAYRAMLAVKEDSGC